MQHAAREVGEAHGAGVEAIEHVAVDDEDAGEGGEIIHAPVAGHEGFTGAAGATERDLGIHARIVHAHDDGEAAALGEVAEALAALAIHEGDHAMLELRQPIAQDASRQRDEQAIDHAARRRFPLQQLRLAGGTDGRAHASGLRGRKALVRRM